MSQQSSYPPPPYGGTPQYGPPKRSRGPLILVIVLGLVLVAAVVVGAVVVLRKDDSDVTKGGSAGVPASPESVQFRAVLSAEPKGCEAATTATPDGTACGADGTRYTLGPVALDGTHVTEVRTGQSQGNSDLSWQVNLTLDGEGEATFTKLTTDLAAKTPPQNQLAIVVRGKVVSAPTVMSAIPGGKVQITSQFSKADAEKLAADITG
jgi:hypothetical protein